MKSFMSGGFQQGAPAQLDIGSLRLQ